MDVERVLVPVCFVERLLDLLSHEYVHSLRKETVATPTFLQQGLREGNTTAVTFKSVVDILGFGSQFEAEQAELRRRGQVWVESLLPSVETADARFHPEHLVPSHNEHVFGHSPCSLLGFTPVHLKLFRRLFNDFPSTLRQMKTGDDFLTQRRHGTKGLIVTLDDDKGLIVLQCVCGAVRSTVRAQPNRRSRAQA